eukprot:NODE_1116_length_2138_cov_0.027464.p1 type:complete len:243 gc:universal NODE_1116_length_2138_cov_0.027464:1892-1164(-)
MGAIGAAANAKANLKLVMFAAVTAVAYMKGVAEQRCQLHQRCVTSASASRVRGCLLMCGAYAPSDRTHCAADSRGGVVADGAAAVIVAGKLQIPDSNGSPASPFSQCKYGSGTAATLVYTTKMLRKHQSSIIAIVSDIHTHARTCIAVLVVQVRLRHRLLRHSKRNFLLIRIERHGEHWRDATRHPGALIRLSRALRRVQFLAKNVLGTVPGVRIHLAPLPRELRFRAPQCLTVRVGVYIGN